MKNKRGKVLMAAGCLFVAGALALMIYNYAEERRADSFAEKVADILTRQVIPEQAADSAAVTSGGTDDGETDAGGTVIEKIQSVKIDGDQYIGVLDIPSLDLSLPIM